MFSTKFLTALYRFFFYYYYFRTSNQNFSRVARFSTTGTETLGSGCKVIPCDSEGLGSRSLANCANIPQGAEEFLLNE